MSVAVDANVLVYASDESSAFHAKALDLVEGLARGTELLYLFWPVVLGYLIWGVVTRPAIFHRPLSVKARTGNIDALSARPQTRSPGEGETFWPVHGATTAHLVVRGDLVPDAHHVALMRENGVGTLWTHHRDLRQFEGSRVRDPFA
jgi:toxin-antitoxin system PIN domain toxin